MATDTTDKPGKTRQLGWFAGLYIASITVVAGVVYGLKFAIAWIVGV
jgi:hypothetical protein